MPDVACYGLGLPTPGIEHVNHGFKRIVAWFFCRGINDVGKLIDLLVVTGTP